MRQKFQEQRLDQPKKDRRPFLEDFLLYHIVLSDQKVSGCYKNSYRKLRVCAFGSEISVKGC